MSRAGASPRTVPAIAVWAVCFVAVVSVVSWRRDAIFTGAIDAVVIAKAILAFAALAGAVAILAFTRPRRPVGAQTALLFAFILGVSAVGAIANGNPMPTFVLIVRVAILAAIVLVLLGAVDWHVVLTGILGSLAIVAVVAAVTGIPKIPSEGRLVGGVPEVAANELAGLAAAPLVALIALLVRDGMRWRTGLAALVLGSIVWATASRTGLLAIAVACLVAFFAAGRVHWTTSLAVIVAMPVAYAFAVYTTVVRDFIVRGQTLDDISTLSARTDAWQVVFSWAPDSWERWLGLGLAVKEVPVTVDNREFQVLDSSWISALAQTGVLGVILLLAVLAPTVVRAVTLRDRRWIVLPLLTLILVRAFTESGLVDSSVTFLLFFLLAASMEPGTRAAVVPLATGSAFRDDAPFRGGAFRPRQPAGATE